MMDAVFEAQFRLMKDDFARRGVPLEVAYRADGTVDYLYRPGHLLTLATDENLAALSYLLPGCRPTQQALRASGETMTLTTSALADGGLTVPEALDLIDQRRGNRNLTPDKGSSLPLASPDHIIHVSRICPAVEPEVPSGHPAAPWPAPRSMPTPSSPGSTSGPSCSEQILIGVSDTGLLEKLDLARYTWLHDVTGDPDLLGPITLSGLPRIPAYNGHGTFVAGVAKCEAPNARVVVNDHFSASGGELESVIVAKLEELVLLGPQVINLSAGTYTRRDWTSLGFHSFNRRHPEIAFVAAAGNDSTARPFWPAAFDWAVSVGALGADQQHRAWFSNHGPWVDVYALGEGMVNAFATGEFTYREPPKMPATQTFDGMARWDGTSFSAPLVAGVIAERMARTGDTAENAVRAVLKFARAQSLPGVGPVIYPGDTP